MGSCCKKAKKKNKNEQCASFIPITIVEEKLLINENENIDSDTEKFKNLNKISIQDFKILKLLGKGSFAKVFLVKEKKTKKIYALKILFKKLIKKFKQQNHTITECFIMQKFTHKNIIKLKCSFQDEERLYFLMEFVQGGELYFHLHKERKFDSKKVKFYVIEIILALEYLHNKNIIYRDLKPENVLIDKLGHIKLTDFGLSKIFDFNNEKDNDTRLQRAYTLCGTPNYLAPEILLKQGYEKSVDYFSLGCLMYEMLSGKTPYNFKYLKNDTVDDNEENEDDKNEKFHISLGMFKKAVSYPAFLSEEEKSFIQSLIKLDPKNRLGYGENGIENIKKHKYFNDIDWNKYQNYEVIPPFIPELKNDEDVKYFHKYFTEESNINLDCSNLSDEDLNKMYDNYLNFSYVNVSENSSVKNKKSRKTSENIKDSNADLDIEVEPDT